MIKYLFLIVTVFCWQESFAQSEQNSLEITGVRSLQFFTPHNESNNGNILLEGNIIGFEAAYKISMANNAADFVRIFNVSSIDIAASYRSYGNVTENNDPLTKGFLGSTYILLGRMNMNLAALGPVKLYFAPAFGFAYASQTYFTNGNFVLGSHLNLAAQAGLNLQVALSQTLALAGGVDVLHLSDGAFRTPNNGLNAFNVSLGVIHTIAAKGPVNKPVDAYQSKSLFEIGADIGRRGVYQSKDGLYKSGLFAAYGYKLSPVFIIKAEFDAIYYYTVFNPANYDYTFQYYGSSYDRWRTGVSLAADVVLGKLVVTANYGIYLHNNSPLSEKYYWTPGLQYDVCHHLALQGKVYINKASADYLGVGLVYKYSGGRTN